MDIRRILFPTDFSEGSAHAISYVTDLVKHYRARLYVIHVIYDIAHATGWYVPHTNIDDLYREMEKDAARELESSFVEELRGYKEIEYKLLKGLPYEEILKFSEGNGIDLIIMGTHGRKGLERVIFGSTAERVVRHSKCPVLTVGSSK